MCLDSRLLLCWDNKERTAHVSILLALPLSRCSGIARTSALWLIMHTCRRRHGASTTSSEGWPQLTSGHRLCTAHQFQHFVRLTAPLATVLPQVAAVLKRCAAQSAAGGPRCSELERYMTNCIKVDGQLILAYLTTRVILTYATVPQILVQAACAATTWQRGIEGQSSGLLEALNVMFTAQVHGPQCLRCTYSTVKKVSARESCCTAVRDRRAYALQRCQVGEA
jgi:hypothetical protein